MNGPAFDLEKFLDPKTIELQLSATDREAAIRELSALLGSTGYVTDTDAFVADVLAREAQGATGLGFGVAIPHGKSPAVERTTVAIGRMAEAVEWPSLDGEGVSTVILFAVRDQDADTLHLRLLQRIAILLADDSFLEELAACATPQDVITLMTTKNREKEQ